MEEPSREILIRVTVPGVGIAGYALVDIPEAAVAALSRDEILRRYILPCYLTATVHAEPPAAQEPEQPLGTSAALRTLHGKG